MTYRYCQLAQGKNLSERSGILWRDIVAVVPCNKNGEELVFKNEADELFLWEKQVVSWEIKEHILYARLEV